jgi:hypothetical protein
VVQTASGTRDQWHIHELRIFDGARELERAPAWRLEARPSPWTIREAFDGSLLTFWITGEWIRPGQYVEVRFGGTEAADAVVIDTSADQAAVRLRLEGRPAGGEWTELAPAPEISDVAPPLRMRRSAAEELKRRGIDYVLVLDTEVVARDLRENTEQWGVRLAGEAGRTRLYELPRVVPDRPAAPR